ncbi:putative ATPase related to phosphate starvation-inducible protein PhoH (plasmid) [Euzebya pacifica]|uniref:Putative ATPase related to phosphate starvation-inducible protein PhoH n=1 Tax=Euzebya pacifica TaxID=1608957 RepID=A0A346Y779_9ACTN|nr:PhoH family protein [Euzebya pacifica]AXV10326.1 putative ATPase related to phosphate starvation-inducible protein PhoH [Euzebya pacifica]
MTTPKRTFVLDTNVLIADPQAIGYPAANGRLAFPGRFDEHDVVIPIRVIEELEGLRNRPFEVGFAAREALRNIEALRVVHGTLANPVTINDQGGTVRIELNNTSRANLHEALQADTSDHRIIAVAKNLADAGHDVVLVSKDAPVRIKASVEGLAAEEFKNEQWGDSGWSGVVDAHVPQEFIDELYASGPVGVALTDAPDSLINCVANTCLNLSGPRSGTLARVHADKRVRAIADSQTLGGKIRGRNAEQRFAIDLLLDPRVGIVSLAGLAGSGKTMLAVLAGLQQRDGGRVQVFRPLDAVGGPDQSVGFLPGTLHEKMSPYVSAIRDSLEVVYAPHEIDSMLERRSLTVEPVTYVRGRTLRGHIVLDEAQSWERRPLEALLTRAGEDSKVVLCWDQAQSDNSRATPEAGVAGLRDRFKGHPIFGHVTLRRTERSAIASAVNEVLHGTN